MDSNILKQGKIQLQKLDKHELHQAQQFLASDINELFTELGHEVLGDGALLDDLHAAGKRIFWNLSDELRKRLCGNQQLKGLADPANADTADGLALLAVIAALVQPDTGEGINALLVAAIVVRLGLRQLCDKTWKL